MNAKLQPADLQSLLAADFGSIPAMVHAHALVAPGQRALVQGDQSLNYAELDVLSERVAASLQASGLQVGQAIALCAATSINYAAVFLGVLRAGMVVVPLTPGATPASLQAMLIDADARLLFLDDSVKDQASEIAIDRLQRISLDDSGAGRPLSDWLVEPGRPATAVQLDPDQPFNIIYSSGTTGEPKGIVQPHGMRWAYSKRAAKYGYGPDTVSLLSTPLYSNTTLVVFFPTLTFGGTVVLQAKFEAQAWLRLAEKERITHTMLVPVQYQRLLAHPEFDHFDLSSFRYKFSTSAPFAPTLKAEVLRRWPGGLVEFYGMTEGGGSCILEAHVFPDKLHTVGQPAAGHDIRLIDEQGDEVSLGQTGEVVGHSPGMMKGYHKRPDLTRQAEWFDAMGKRFIRTGDVGRFDEDGYLTLLDRRKDLIISGGFNLYPSDLEAVLCQHPAVQEAAVVGVASERWGETPLAFVVRQPGQHITAAELKDWANQRLGKTQRLTDLRFMASLPRSPIGKVLKRELRDSWSKA